MIEKIANPITLGASGISVGIIAVALQIAVTIISTGVDGFDGYIAEYSLACSSVGVWTGVLFVVTGTVGILSSTRKRKPAVGSVPARSFYAGYAIAFLILSFVSGLFSIVLAGISGTLFYNTLNHDIHPSIMPAYRYGVRIPKKENSMAPIVYLSCMLLVIGLVAMFLQSLAVYSSWRMIHRFQSGKVILFSGPPTGMSAERSKNIRHIEVITRPAMEISTPSFVHFSPKSFSAVLDDGPSFYF